MALLVKFICHTSYCSNSRLDYKQVQMQAGSSGGQLHEPSTVWQMRSLVHHQLSYVHNRKKNIFFRLGHQIHTQPMVVVRVHLHRTSPQVRLFQLVPIRWLSSAKLVLLSFCVFIQYKGGSPTWGLGPQGARASTSGPSGRHNDDKNGKRGALLLQRNTKYLTPEPATRTEKTKTPKQDAFAFTYLYLWFMWVLLSVCVFISACYTLFPY